MMPKGLATSVLMLMRGYRGSRVRDLGLLFRDFQQKKVRDVDWLGLSPVAKRVRDFGRLVRLIGFCTVFCRL